MKTENISGFENDRLNLTDEQKDFLKELGNIGSGNAIVALSKLLNRKVEVSLTSVEVIGFWELIDALGGGDTKVFGIYSIIKKEPYLSILQIYTKESLINIINSISQKEEETLEKIKSLEDFDDYTLSMISEIGNILSGHYTNALADLMSVKLVPDVPSIAFDRLGAIADGVIGNCSEILDYLITIHTELKIEDLNLKGLFCFLPSIEMTKKIFEAINDKYGL